MKAYILRPLGPFYSYLPTTLTLMRAVCYLKFSGLSNIPDELLIAGPFAYRDGKFYVPGGPRVELLEKDVEGEIVSDEDSPMFYTIDGDGILIDYPFIATVVPRLLIDRATFTSGSEEGRVAYAQAYFLKHGRKLAIITDLPKDVIRKLGILGLGRYRSIGGGKFVIESGREVSFDGSDVTVFPHERLEYGRLEFYPYYEGTLKMLPYYNGGILKEEPDSYEPPHKEILLDAGGAPCGIRFKHQKGFPKRSARAPFIIFQPRGGSSSR